MKIQPIKTKYKRQVFRSRLEARWAIFFDKLEIKWEYEAEGYNLGGKWYLPDFWLPEFEGGTHVEVKHIGGDFTKAKRFTVRTGKSMWLCEGPPAARVYDIVYGEGEFAPYSLHIVPGTPEWDAARGLNRFFVFPGYEEPDGTYDEDWCDYNPFYMAAVDEALNYDFKSY